MLVEWGSEGRASGPAAGCWVGKGWGSGGQGRAVVDRSLGLVGRSLLVALGEGRRRLPGDAVSCLGRERGRHRFAVVVVGHRVVLRMDSFAVGSHRRRNRTLWVQFEEY